MLLGPDHANTLQAKMNLVQGMAAQRRVQEQMRLSRCTCGTLPSRRRPTRGRWNTLADQVQGAKRGCRKRFKNLSACSFPCPSTLRYDHHQTRSPRRLVPTRTTMASQRGKDRPRSCTSWHRKGYRDCATELTGGEQGRLYYWF